MKHSFFVRTLFTLGIVSVVLPMGALRAEELTADEIVDRGLRFAAAERERNEKFTYRRVARRQELDGDGQPERTSQRVYRSELIEGHSFERLVSIDGAPPAGDDLEKEQEREAAFRKRIAEKQDDEIPFDRKLADRYRFTLLGREVIEGRPAHVLSFVPATDRELPDDKPEDAVLGALRGKVWVDTEEFAVARIRARLTRTVRLGLGLLATIKKAYLDFDIRKSPSGKWLPVSMKTYLWGRTMLFKTIRHRETSRFTNFERVL